MKLCHNSILQVTQITYAWRNLRDCGRLEHGREAVTLISSGEISQLAFPRSTIPWLSPVPVIWGTPLRTNYCRCSAQPSTLFGWWEFLFLSCPPYSPGSIKFPLGYVALYLSSPWFTEGRSCGCSRMASFIWLPRSLSCTEPLPGRQQDWTPQLLGDRERAVMVMVIILNP